MLESPVLVLFVNTAWYPTNKTGIAVKMLKENEQALMLEQITTKEISTKRHTLKTETKKLKKTWMCQPANGTDWDNTTTEEMTRKEVATIIMARKIITHPSRAK